MKIYKAPQMIHEGCWPSVFLAGSIEMGKAEDWQTKVTNALSDLPVTIFNPRRDDWDSSWEQKKENAQFREQVEWELSALERATIIVMYFDPSTMSPISLLELGLHAEATSSAFIRSKLIVCCPEGFWRKGNVDIVCERYGIRQVDNVEALINAVRKELE
jgi:hypothetical protein